VSDPKTGTRQPLAAVEAEAAYVLEAARREGLQLRALGGVAVAMLARASLPAVLQRSYADIDLATGRDDGGRTRSLLVGLGYSPDVEFNSLHGSRRLLFYDRANGRRIDVFVGVLRMCHELELDARLGLVPDTLTPADLLLTKLQIVELNPKDLQDVLAVLLVCGVGDEPRSDQIDLPRLTLVTGDDWGWHTTISDNLKRVSAAADMLSDDGASVVRQRVQTIQGSIDLAPKSLRWKLRARVGRHMQWYDLPEEVAP
jgi:hypothetical protein